MQALLNHNHAKLSKMLANLRVQARVVILTFFKPKTLHAQVAATEALLLPSNVAVQKQLQANSSDSRTFHFHSQFHNAHNLQRLVDEESALTHLHVGAMQKRMQL